MQLKDLFEQSRAKKRPLVSFEVFPPKAENGLEKLYEHLDAFRELDPAFVSVTYGAGGSTRAFTLLIASHLVKHGFQAMAHLTTVGSTQEEIRAILQELRRAGVENVIALRGDPPQGMDRFVAQAGGFAHAGELVSFMQSAFKGEFGIAVAGYPEGHVEAESLEKDLHYLAQKVAAGAQMVITQLFFENDVFFDFVARARAAGITVPISAGIMPVNNPGQVKRITQMCGAKFPAELEQALEAAGDKAEEVGTDWAVKQIKGLLARGVDGIHLYTMNRPRQTARVMALSGLK